MVLRQGQDFVQASADIRTNRKQFMEAVCAGYGIQPRRLEEAVAVYKQYAKPSDSLMETCERIFQEKGNWSKALPPKPKRRKPRSSAAVDVQYINDEWSTLRDPRRFS